MPTNL